MDAGIDPDLAPKPEPGQEPPEKLPKQIIGSTPLQLAAIQGKIKAMKALIKEGADINARNARKFTALHMAVAEGRLEVARFLLDEGAEPEALDDHGRTPLYESVLRGNLEITSLLIGSGHDPDFGAEPDLHTGLMGSILAKNPVMARHLLDLGADPHLRTTRNINYLHMAALPGGSTQIVRMLLKTGIDPSLASDKGFTALHRATATSTPYLKTDKDQIPKLIHETVTLLINAGAEVDATTRKKNRTALHRAVAAGYTDAARALLDAGADPLLKTSEGETAQALAERHGHDEVIPLIHQALNRRLLTAAQSGTVADVRALLAAGADPATTDNDGRTPLELAENHGQTESATMLRNM